MNVYSKATILAILLSVCAISAYAVPPAYQGPLGNDEEPATRPYKWLWRGVQAFVYQPIVSLGDGNRKTGGWGSFEAVRGFRKGSVELAESAFKGMIGTPVPPKDDFKKEGSVNRFINKEPLFSTIADGVIPKVVDAYPMNDETEQEELRQKVEKHKQAQAEAKKPVEVGLSERDAAQKRYIGERAVINKQNGPVKNYLKEFRK